MHKNIVVNVTEHETRVALLENEMLVELHVERWNNLDVVGNIYKGRVQKVLPGIQAAFVDIGFNQAAFIHVRDIIKDNCKDIVEQFIKADNSGESISKVNNVDFCRQVTDSCVNIEDCITEGQEILVQVTKTPTGKKGAYITTHISLPGRLLVLLPTDNHVGISRRIKEEERDRLKNLVLSLKKEDCGCIVRTAAQGSSEEKLAYELEYLCNLWEKIQKRFMSVSAPALLNRGIAISCCAARDLLTLVSDRLIIDSADAYRSALLFVEQFMPGFKDSIELYDGLEPIFDMYNIEGDISRALQRNVRLKSGGYIVIEQTEALVAIDVNTGRYVGKNNHEETILKTNLEAVKEIARQIRLRDTGGIIIVDIIDMDNKSDREKIDNAFQDAIQNDRSKINLLPISEIGLIQMTRQRIRKSLAEMLYEPCICCDGHGHLISRQSVCYDIYREALRKAGDMTGVKLVFCVNHKIADILYGEEQHIIESLEKIIKKQIVICTDKRLSVSDFNISETLI